MASDLADVASDLAVESGFLVVGSGGLRVELHLPELASPPPSGHLQAIVKAIEICYLTGAMPVPAPAQPWRLSGRWWLSGPRWAPSRRAASQPRLWPSLAWGSKKR